MSIIVTAVLIGVIAFKTFSGAKKGLVRTVISLIGTIISFFIAKISADILSPSVAGNIPLPGIGSGLSSAINKLELVDRTKEGLFTVLTNKGFPDLIAGYITDKIDFSDTANSLAVQVSDTFNFVAAYILIFIAALIISLLLIALISLLLDGIMKLPILRTLNTVTGAVLGFLTGFVLVWLILLSISWITPVFDACFSTNFAEIIPGSIILKILLSINPFEMFL